MQLWSEAGVIEFPLPIRFRRGERRAAVFGGGFFFIWGAMEFILILILGLEAQPARRVKE
jgi:hypothetical protein